MSTTIKVTVKKPVVHSFDTIDKLTPGELYTFTYTSGRTVIGVCAAVAPRLDSDRSDKYFIPLQLKVANRRHATCCTDGDKPFYVWNHPKNSTLFGIFTPFTGNVTLKSS